MSVLTRGGLSTKRLQLFNSVGELSSSELGGVCAAFSLSLQLCACVCAYAHIIIIEYEVTHIHTYADKMLQKREEKIYEKDR